jgi:hypothetical protein
VRTTDGSALLCALWKKNTVAVGGHCALARAPGEFCHDRGYALGCGHDSHTHGTCGQSVCIGVCTALGTMVAVARSGASRLQAAARRDDGGALRTGGLHPIAYRTLGGEGKVGRSSALAMCVQGHDLLWPSHASGALRIP